MGVGMTKGKKERPPAVARELVRWVVGRDEAPTALGELGETFSRRGKDRGFTRARLWYWRQSLGFVLRAPLLRRERREETMRWFGDLGGDVRWAIRGLKSRPTFTAVAVATLALGIGANSAIFSLVSSYFLTPLPYHAPDDVVLIWETRRNSDEVMTVSPGNYFTWREGTESFDDVAAFNVNRVVLSGDGLAEGVTASVVTPHFFEVLGTPAALGRTFDQAGAIEANGALVVLGHSLWVRRYGSDPAVVGRDIRVNGTPHTVVGVMPPTFRQPERRLTWQSTELWRPLLLESRHDDFDSRYLRTVARLRSEVSADQAQAEMDLMSRRMAQAYPDQNGGRNILVRTLDQYLMSDARSTLWMLLIAGGTVLLIVCANVANLTLARGEERRREFAVRAALGSGRRRLLRQVAVEGVVLALAGAALGALFVLAGRDVLQSVQARFFTGLVDASIDGRVVAFTTALAVFAGVLFCLPMARAASRPNLRESLGEGSQRAGRRGGSVATQNLLIVGQVALATTVVVVAGLLSRSFNELVNVAPGFQAEDVVTFNVGAPSARYEDSDAVRQYLQDIWTEVESVPGVQAVGMISDMPFTTENRWQSLHLEGQPYDAQTAPRAEFHAVLPEYFDVMGIPIVSGELPGDAWEASGEVPILINRRMSESFWSGMDPMGQSFTLAPDEDVTYRVTGVVGNVLDDGFDAVPEPIFYMPWGGRPQRSMAVVARTNGKSPEVLQGIRAAVARVDPDIPAAELRPLDALLAETVARPRAASLIGGTFALLALLVAASGIHGVLSYTVQRRTSEIGIRSALGATGGQLVSMVLGQSTRLVAMGLVLGLVAALATGRFLSGLLFGVRSWDPITLAATVVVLGTVGTVAAWLPARRAVKIDPKDALHSG
jgi:putative ABC transport system permease protein